MKQQSSSIMTYEKAKEMEHYLLEAKPQEFLLRQHQNTHGTSQMANKQPRGEERG
jgi:hypothetical protein